MGACRCRRVTPLPIYGLFDVVDRVTRFKVLANKKSSTYLVKIFMHAKDHERVFARHINLIRFNTR